MRILIGVAANLMQSDRDPMTQAMKEFHLRIKPDPRPVKTYTGNCLPGAEAWCKISL
jgi:hypothetical protein